MKKNIFTDQIGQEVGDNTKSDYVIYKNSDKIPISDLIFYKKNEGGKDFGCYPCNKLVYYNNFGADSDYYKIGFGSDMFWCGDGYMSVPNFIAGDKGFLNSDTDIKQKLGSTNKDDQPSIYFSEGHEDVTFNHQLLQVSSFTSYKKNEDTQIKVGKDADLLFEEEVHRDGRDMHELEINVIDAPVIDQNNRIPFWDETSLTGGEVFSIYGPGVPFAGSRLPPSREKGQNTLGIRVDHDLIECICRSWFLKSFVWHEITQGDAPNRPFYASIPFAPTYRNDLYSYAEDCCKHSLLRYHHSPHDPPKIVVNGGNDFSLPNYSGSWVYDHVFHDQGSTRQNYTFSVSSAEVPDVYEALTYFNYAKNIAMLRAEISEQLTGGKPLRDMTLDEFKDVLHEFQRRKWEVGGSSTSRGIYHSVARAKNWIAALVESYLQSYVYGWDHWDPDGGLYNPDTRSSSWQLIIPEDPDGEPIFNPSVGKSGFLVFQTIEQSDYAKANGLDKALEMFRLYGARGLAGANTSILQSCFPKGHYHTNELLTFAPITNFRWPKDATSANGTELFDGTIGPPLRSFTPNKEIRYNDFYDQDIIDYVTAPRDTVNFTVEI